MTGLRKRIMDDTFLINTLLLAFLVMALALQALIVLAWIYSFIPIKPSPLFSTLFSRHQALVVFKRDISFYHFFIGTASILMAGGMVILKSRLSLRALSRQLLALSVAEYGLTFLMVFAVFKMFVYGFEPWTKDFFYISLGASLLSKIFWNEITAFYKWSMHYWAGHEASNKGHRWWDASFTLLIFLIIFIPDTQALLAKTFITDHFVHFDGTIMSPAWAQLKGGVLDHDQYSIYAIGLPVVIGHLAQLLGGFSYVSVMSVLVIGTVFYYIGVYALARFWLKSIPLSMAMVILLIKWQMFHPEVAPVIFNYPSITIWRYPLDIALLFLLLSHLRRHDGRLLIAAALVCGFSSFYMVDTGVYMDVAYAFYMVFALIMDLQQDPAKARGKVLKAAGTLLIVPVTTLGCLWIVQGQYLFTRTFWHILAERTAFFLMGYGDLPMYGSLVQGKYLDSLVGFLIPWFYTLVLIVTSTLLFLRRIPRAYLFIATLSIYGLGLYHYYVNRSGNSCYYVGALPLVFILGYILHWTLGQEDGWRKQILGSVLALAFFSLLTNHYFLIYPNLVNLSRDPQTHPIIPMKVEDGLSFFNHNDMKWPEQIKLSTNSLGETAEELKTEDDFADDRQLKDFFKQEFDFSQDAALIRGLTDKDQPVPLISSFETRILIQADRRPFFYYFPLVDSRPMHMRMFDMTELWTTDRLKQTLLQLQDAKVPYIFMEKILLAQSVPRYYEYLYPDLLVILNYIHQNYVPYKQGHYLVAMKRIDALK